MTTPVATIVVAVVAVIGTIVGAAVSAWLNRDRDDAEVATKVSQAWDPVFNRYDKEFERLGQKCDKCETALSRTRDTLAAVIEVVEELTPLLPAGETEARRKAQVAIHAARLSITS